MTNESKFCDEICRRRSGEAEFWRLLKVLASGPELWLIRAPK